MDSGSRRTGADWICAAPDAPAGRRTNWTRCNPSVGGVDGFYTRPIERLHIPRLKMSDGPAGVRTWRKTTAYPAPISFAASFDPGLVLRIGSAYGKDARARGVDFLLAPGVNIYRVPM